MQYVSLTCQGVAVASNLISCSKIYFRNFPSHSASLCSTQSPSSPTSSRHPFLFSPPPHVPYSTPTHQLSPSAPPLLFSASFLFSLPTSSPSLPSSPLPTTLSAFFSLLYHSIFFNIFPSSLPSSSPPHSPPASIPHPLAFSRPCLPLFLIPYQPPSQVLLLLPHHPSPSSSFLARPSCLTPHLCMIVTQTLHFPLPPSPPPKMSMSFHFRNYLSLDFYFIRILLNLTDGSLRLFSPACSALPPSLFCFTNYHYTTDAG